MKKGRHKLQVKVLHEVEPLRLNLPGEMFDKINNRFNTTVADNNEIIKELSRKVIFFRNDILICR